MTSQLIIEIIGAVLGKMGIVFESVEELEAPTSHGMKRYVIKTGESGLLIGAKGVNFSALNHIVKKMVSKKAGGGEVRFILDVNDYNKKIADELATKVTILRERALSLKADIELDPMSPFERMLVHTMCEGVANIKTESRGEGLNRRVVIRYVENITSNL